MTNGTGTDTLPPAGATLPDLRGYTWIVVNSSAGKDSQAMLDLVVSLAREQGVMERVVVVHADLQRVEWQGTAELAERQAKHYGLRFIKVSREQGDLLDQIEARGKFPDAQNRFCTSDHKRAQVDKVFTALVAETRAMHKGARVRVLNCMGLRAQESPKRAKMVDFEPLKRATNGRREVDQWLPIHAWTEAQVWERIRASGVPYHPAYDLGMPRLSCCFCVLASKDALLLAGHHNRALLDEYVRVEQKIGHTFRHKLPIIQIRDAVERGERPDAGKVSGWCA